MGCLKFDNTISPTTPLYQLIVISTLDLVRLLALFLQIIISFFSANTAAPKSTYLSHRTHK